MARRGPSRNHFRPGARSRYTRGMEALDAFSLRRQEFIAEAAARVGRGSGIAGAMYRKLFAEGILDFAGASPSALPRWEAAFRAGYLAAESTLAEEGPFGTTRKARLELRGGGAVECVLIPTPSLRGEGGASLCVSTQLGCRMGCAFCETAAMGFSRDLSAGEIVGQVMTARHVLGWEFTKVVFMGMGEPLDNFGEFSRALAVLSDQGGMAMDLGKLTVCTVGHAEGIRKLAALGYKRLNLAVSLNAAIEGKRRQLMPATARWGLAELKEALAAYSPRKSFVLVANYCLMPGVNDGEEDAEAVARFLDGIGRAVANLIPYNPGSRPLCRAPEEAELDAFEARLRARGVMVKRRATKGRSIMAGCGQLGRAASPDLTGGSP